jgi:hypothetical protein
MKIKCKCGSIIVDQTDCLKSKGYIISDTQWFEFWDAIDEAIEKSGPSKIDKERASTQLGQQQIFKTVWECSDCGKLFVDSKNGKLISYSPDSHQYCVVLDRKDCL